MSYEGYVVYLCENGHQHVYDCYNEPNIENWKCPDCGKPVSWYTNVDETNGTDEETGKCPGEVELEVLKEEYCRCEKCGNKHLLEPITYKIPNHGGHKIKKSQGLN